MNRVYCVCCGENKAKVGELCHLCYTGVHQSESIADLSGELATAIAQRDEAVKWRELREAELIDICYAKIALESDRAKLIEFVRGVQSNRSWNYAEAVALLKEIGE